MTYRKKIFSKIRYEINFNLILDGSLPANPVNDRHIANAETLKSTFLSTIKSAIIQKYLIMEPPEK